MRQRRLEASHQLVVLDRLASIFGPRGLQHFVFVDLLGQIESIANAYLDVLADGGIRLALQNEQDTDRVIKSVSVKSGSGTYNERSLSQLSGGQWRRVSMALDFAFVELIRRRGILRCNMMVMDEVLTHLDASGRESFGTILRAMVNSDRGSDGSSPTESSTLEVLSAAEGPAVGQDIAQDYVDDAGDGSAASTLAPSLHNLLGGGVYDTVLVILQDLVATELEESFDHIDVVVKNALGATVNIDGQRSQTNS